MKHKFTFLPSFLLLVMAMLWSSLAAHAQDEVLIRFHTNVPEKAKNSGVAAQVSFVLGSKSDKADVSIDYGSGDTEVEINKLLLRMIMANRPLRVLSVQMLCQMQAG